MGLGSCVWLVKRGPRNTNDHANMEIARERAGVRVGPKWERIGDQKSAFGGAPSEELARIVAPSELVEAWMTYNLICTGRVLALYKLYTTIHEQVLVG